MNRKVVALLVLGSLCATMSAGAVAATGSVRVQASIDGLSELILRDNTAQWYHIEYSPPGQTLLNGIGWTPTGLSSFCNCLSDVFAGVAPAIPQDATNFSVLKSSGRGEVTLVELPSSANSFTLRVRFDDVAPGGADNYDVTVRYDYSSTPPPAPAAQPIPTLGAWGLGLLGLSLAGLARRRTRGTR